MADEILDALQKIDARVASMETTLHKVEARTASIETVLNEFEHDINGMKMRFWPDRYNDASLFWP